MDTQETSTTNSVVVLEPREVSFLDDNIELKPLLRLVTKETKAAIAVLAGLLESKDERTRLTAATKLLELQVSLAKEINTDQMQRLIAQVKLGGATTGRLVAVEEEEEKLSKPRVDFTQIQTV